MSTTKSAISVNAWARQVVAHVRSLERAHRAGITPRYGQLEDLFDTADRLERHLDESDAGAGVLRCAIADCQRPPVGGNHAWSELCYSCAGAAIATAMHNGSWQPPPLATRP